MKKSMKKLSLNKQTVRNLTGSELRDAAGGAIGTFSNPVCSTAYIFHCMKNTDFTCETCNGCTGPTGDGGCI